ncbi:ORF6N domain-containing protein [Desulfonema magnum]|uniref:DNA-binding domain-containing protein, KilA-N-like and DUF559 n=1 Tax=Desulfonema magnum TaxID=45655 RepID=A0A975BFA1_9BACT|nr:ORF6N domain-containing protein [Desulfonema magnum]QTA84361.1 DNA-binding domain-containing protein, KilA-N-like and DUF559 [Desulfonema magnum]
MDNKRIVNIMGRDIERIEYKGQPVITFRMMDELHERPEGTARRAFNYHKNKFVKKENFFEVAYKEWSQIPTIYEAYGSIVCQRNHMIFLTQAGYLLVVTSYRSSTEKISEICNKYFEDNSLNFLLSNAAEIEFGKTLTETLKGLATVKTQVRINKYRADFLLSEYDIIVEYDEEYHRYLKTKNSDKQRDKILMSLGYTVIRVRKREPIGRALNRILLAISDRSKVFPRVQK